MRKVLLIVGIALTSTACNELLQVANTANAALNTSTGVTNAENIAGLKSALNVGIEGAVKNLGATNGFFNDAALKILLPTEAQSIVNNIKLIPGGQKLVDDAILSLNRAAEDAVKEATPIFKNAITSMTITDATNILFGSNNAATSYLKNKTYTQLKTAFAPKVKTSLDKPLVANVSTNQSWKSLTSAYNSVAGTAVGAAAGMKSVNVNLEEYVTEKALDALFVKVAAEEKEIRTDPVARVNAILQKVFGQLDK